MAMFGDLAPITTLTKAATPAGFKVARANMKTGHEDDFAVNRVQGPASRLLHDGFERPSHCQFRPDGSLYVVDFGIIHIAPERGGIRQQIGTGSLWRIRRTEGPQGIIPPKPITIPVYLLQGLAIVGRIVGVAVLGSWLVKRLKNRRTQNQL